MILLCIVAVGFLSGSLLVRAPGLALLPDVRYKYMSHPLMMAVHDEYIYLIDGREGHFYLDIFNRVTLGDRTDIGAPSQRLLGVTDPRHIDITGRYLFLFDSRAGGDFVTVWNTNDMSIVTTQSISTQRNSAFHISNTDDGIHIVYARGASFWRTEFTPVGGTFGSTSPATTLLAPHTFRTITSLTTDPSGTVFSGTELGLIFRERTLVQQENPFGRPIPSMVFLNNRLVFIHDRNIHTMSPVDNATVQTLAPNPTNIHGTQTSQVPLSLFPFQNNQLFVIDAFKRSIDRYTIHAVTGALAFDGIVAGSQGSDGGFHFLPHAVAVIDESQYIVADLTGVKLIDTRLNVVRHFTTDIFIDIAFDGWRTIYLTEIITEGQYRVHRYILNPNYPAFLNYQVTNNLAEVLPARNFTNALGEVFDLRNLTVTELNDNNIPADLREVIGNPERWSLCRLTGRIFYISMNHRHAIRYHQIPDYWSPVGFEHLQWRSRDLLTVGFATTGLFQQTQNIGGRQTILFEYPNAIRPMHQLNPGTQLMVLSDRATMYQIVSGNRVPAHANPFDWSMVLLGNRTYYVYIGNLANTTFARRDLHLLPHPHTFRLDNFSARVLINNMPIYRFPFAEPDQSNFVRRERRNFNLGGQANLGLLIYRMITVPVNNLTFFEILVDENGLSPLTQTAADDTARFNRVAFVDARWVMDSLSPARSLVFSSNARIVMPSDMHNPGLPAYAFENGVWERYEGEYLSNNQRVRIGNRSHDGRVEVFFLGYDGDVSVFVDSRFVVPDGLTTWHILAIIGGSVALIVGSAVIVRHFKTRRRPIQEPEIV